MTKKKIDLEPKVIDRFAVALFDANRRRPLLALVTLDDGALGKSRVSEQRRVRRRQPVLEKNRRFMIWNLFLQAI